VKMKINKKPVIIALFFAFIALGCSASLFKAKEALPVNIVLITIDALRPDHLGCYGYKRNTSPHIDRLANSGILFTQAISQGMNTFSSVPSIITSTYPFTHGVFMCGQSISVSSKTLAEILKSRNYSTGLISGYNLFAKIGGLNRGFDMFRCGPPFLSITKKISRIKAVFRSFFRMKPKAPEHCVIYDARKITQAANKWIAHKKHKPFFLWIHYFEAHGFYKNLPGAYKEMFLSDDFYAREKRAPVSNATADVYAGFCRIPYYMIEEGRTDLAYYIAQYDAAIRYIDEQIGVLLEQLKKLGLYDNTILILTADHGESLGEHNFYLDHNTLYDEVIKVPLLIKLDRVSSKKMIVDEQVQSIDIVPTLLGILNIQSPRKMQGLSLLPLLSGEKVHDPDYAFAASLDGIAMRSKGWKLIYALKAATYELYNLRDDPHELNNLVSVEKDRFEYLKQRLDRYMREDFQDKKAVKPILDGETKENLKSFGYMQ
jgi:choline-sulfatase